MSDSKVYLGDAVYVDNDGDSLFLTTSNGIRDTNTVVLEPEVFDALAKYVERFRAAKTAAASPSESE